MKRYQNNVIYFAETAERTPRLFGQFQKDKVYHTLITGKTGTGKTSMLETMIMQEINNNKASVVVFDPHGDLIQRISEKFPDHKLKDLIIIDPSDPTQLHGYNPLKRVSEEQKPLLVSGIIEIFRRLYGSSWGDRLEHILRHCLYLLLEQDGTTLADIPKLLVDEKFRYECRLRTRKEHIHAFWLKEFPKYRADALLPLLSKLSAFVQHPAIYRTVVKPRRDISLRRAMDSKKIILVNISKGKLGHDVSSLIGSLLVTSLSLATYSRANVLQWERPYCSVYIDEFQNFTSTSLVAAFSELRKYNTALTISTQYMSALRPDIRDAVLGNVGSIITFRVSIDEGRVLSKYLYPVFSPEILASLPNYTICLVMMINGTVSVPFWARAVRYNEVSKRKRIYR